MKIWVNTIVHNEENFIWFAIMSVVDYVDKILIYDTGSTDKTVRIIREIQKIKKNKIDFTEVGETDKNEFARQRQKMLENSICDWILILDGDEVWWEDSIKKLKDKIDKNGNHLDGIVVPFVVPVGDIYHIQEEKAGQYKLLGKKGNLSLKAISKKIPGLHLDWPYGIESFFDKDNNLVQDRENVIFLDSPFLHLTHLKRSSKNKKPNKFKYELGSHVSKDFKFPESLYLSASGLVSSPWNKITGLDYIRAKLLTPLRRVKRRISE